MDLFAKYWQSSGEDAGTRYRMLVPSSPTASMLFFLSFIFFIKKERKGGEWEWGVRSGECFEVVTEKQTFFIIFHL